MKIKTQEDFIVSYLKENGSISRNYCLRHFISRLGSHINRLNDKGWNLKGHYEKLKKGRDYVYVNSK